MKVCTEKVHNDIYNFKGGSISKEDTKKFNVQMNLLITWDWVILLHAFISLYLIKKTVIKYILYIVLLCADYDYATN